MRELDPLAVAAWVCGVDAGPETTLYRTLKRVPAGHMLVANHLGSRLTRLWQPPGEGSLDAREARRFGDVLESAVERAAVGRAAIFLSGGIDSSAVAAAAAAVSRAGATPAPLALSLEIEGASEEKEQRTVADALGLDRRSRVAAAGAGLLERALDRAAESLWPAGSAWQPVYDDLVGDAQALGVSTVLDGIGGDELLDAALRPARRALVRGRVSVLREIAAAERAYAGGGMRTVIRGALGRGRRWEPPPYIDPAYRPALAELAARPHDDLLSGRIAAGWEEIWDAGSRQGIAYCHPLWDAEVVSLIRGLPVEALVAGGQAKSPARAYLSERVSAIQGPWPRPAVANTLIRALYAEYAQRARPRVLEFPGLRELGAISGDLSAERFPLPTFVAMLLCERWLHSQ